MIGETNFRGDMLACVCQNHVLLSMIDKQAGKQASEPALHSIAAEGRKAKLSLAKSNSICI